MFKIEILTKKGFKNPRSEHVLSDICGIGVKDVTKVEYSPLYIIDGGISSVEAETIACELLSDRVTENYIVYLMQSGTERYCKVVSKSATEGDFVSVPSSDPNFSVIEVWYKKGVTDTVSESLVKAVKDLGIVKEIKVNTGHKYCLYGGVSRTILNIIATKLLANTLIQECKIR